MSSSTPTYYIKLAHPFKEPLWRQAVLVTPQRGDQPATLAVRAGLEEVEFVKEFAQFRVESLCFVLVQGRKGQIRTSCAAPYRSLELAAQQVASAASSTLADLGSDANYVTASEDPEVKMERAMDEESSSQSAESSEDEEDPVLALLKKQTEKSKAESSTKHGNRSVREELGQKSKSRYPFLDQRARAGKKASGDMDQLLNPAQVSKDDIGTLVSLEILKTLKKSRKKGRARSSSRSSEASSSSSRGQQVKPIGTAKAFRNYRKARKALRRKPLRHVKRYLQEIEDFLGCDESTPYRLADFTKKLSWGKMRTLQRCHLMTSEALQLLLQGKVEETALQLVLNLRAMYQCSLDGGSWTSAWLLTYLPDPLEKPRFGADAGLDPSQSFMPAFRVVCMGDTNGVDIAQGVHEAILKEADCMNPSNVLVYRKRESKLLSQSFAQLFGRENFSDVVCSCW